MVFELHRDTQRLSEFLQKQQGSISYEVMSGYLGRDVEGDARYVLTSARRRLERDGIYFVVERGVGLIRAGNNEVAAIATTKPITKIGREVRRSKKREKHVNIQALTADDRLRFAVERTVINTVGETTSRAFRNKLSKEIEKRDNEVMTVTQMISLPRLKDGGKK